MKTHVISLGGSILAPDGINAKYAKQFLELLAKYAQLNHKFIIITGGGSTARHYFSSMNDILSDVENKQPKSELYDEVGITVTKIHARLLCSLIQMMQPELNVHPHILESIHKINADIIFAGGMKPGHSSDYIAVELAKEYDADEVINLTDVNYVYDSNPKDNPDAKALKQINWEEFKQAIGLTEWTPGAHAPFDPIAAKLAQENNITVVVANGLDLDNVSKILDDIESEGTRISN